MTIKRLAILTVHTSPLAPMGGKKTGGMNVYIRELAQELGERGIKVDIFTRRSTLDEPEIDYAIGENVRVIYLTAGSIKPMNPDDIFPHLSEFTARLMAFATMQNAHYDIVYSHYWLSGWVAQKLNEAWGVPFVQMFHTLGQMKKRILTHGAFLPDQRIMTELEIVNWASRIVAATPAEHSQLLWLYRASRRKIEIVPPGVNMKRFHPLSRAEALVDLGFSPDKRLLLFVGRLEPLKAVDTIITALAVLKQDSPQSLDNVHFVIVGGNLNDRLDPEMNQLKQLTKQYGLEDVVLFVGAKDREELPLYYVASTAVVMPSDYESFGMVALEAMASGTPVIASEVGGLAYLVKDHETGYLIPTREPHSLADRIEKILSDPAKTQQMGLNASHLAQDYAWENIADRLLMIFDDVLGRRTTQTA